MAQEQLRRRSLKTITDRPGSALRPFDFTIIGGRAKRDRTFGPPCNSSADARGEPVCSISRSQSLAVVDAMLIVADGPGPMSEARVTRCTCGMSAGNSPPPFADNQFVKARPVCSLIFCTIRQSPDATPTHPLARFLARQAPRLIHTRFRVVVVVSSEAEMWEAAAANECNAVQRTQPGEAAQRQTDTRVAPATCQSRFL